MLLGPPNQRPQEHVNPWTQMDMVHNGGQLLGRWAIPGRTEFNILTLRCCIFFEILLS